MKPRILVVDDNRDLAGAVALVLSGLSDDVVVAHSAEEALQRLSEAPTDLMFSDVRMPGLSGLDLLERVREREPRARTILFTAYGSVEAAVDAMRRGAYHYLTKPFDHDELLLVAGRAWKEIEDEDELGRLRAEIAERHCFHGLHTRDRRMLRVIDTIRRVGSSDATVLVHGESGTGKELVARALHAESARAARPFVAFNAAALPESLAEVELFGCRKGAYTGADRDRPGLFVEADGGTLLIDELSSMPASLQGKLLRAVQEREVRPVGASAPVRVDARLVSATNVEPQRLIGDGILRKDLYYRLAVVRVGVPPLRERIEDIPLLAELFLDRLSAGKPRRLSGRALRLLMTHDWPGNVRELANVIERAAVMSPADEIGPGDIRFEDDDLGWDPEAADGLGYEEAKREVLEQFQRRYVERLMAETGGNLSESSRRAGITRAALQRILKRLGIHAHDPPAARAG